jgi:hypothetical protein
MNIEVITGLIGLGAGVLSAIVTSLAMRRRNAADASKAITEAAVALVGPLEDRIATMEKELKKLRPLEHRVEELRAGVQRLIDQIRCLGHEPVWVPRDERIGGK